MQNLYISALINVGQVLRILDLPNTAQRGVVGTDSEAAAPASYTDNVHTMHPQHIPIQFTCHALHQHLDAITCSFSCGGSRVRLLLE